MTQGRVSRKYDLLAPLYDYIWRHYTHKTIKKALASAGLKGNETILDIGCGTGALEDRLVKMYVGQNIFACDVSSSSIDRAISKIPANPQVNFAVGDFLSMSIPNRQFDVVFSLSNLHYFTDPEKLLRKAHELAKPQASFVLVDWCRESFRSRFYQAILCRADKGFHRIYSLEEMKELFARTGWTVEEKEFFSIRGYWTMVAIRARKEDLNRSCSINRPTTGFSTIGSM